MRLKLILLITAASLSLNGFLAYKVYKTEEMQEAVRNRFPYLAKRIFLDEANDFIINFIPLRLSLVKYVREHGNKMGIYFEYLPSGNSISANGNEYVQIVSLSKLPLVMSIFKKIERGKMSLNDILVIKKEHLNQGSGSLWKLGENARVSVEDLIKVCLTESDNTAYLVLFDALTDGEGSEVFNALDIQTVGEGEYQSVSPKTYSSIFRSLFLSSFITKESSNRILEILTETEFKDKLAAGLPADVKFAHKVGFLKTADASQDVFIDCGIIYVPNRPYILCMFDRETDQLAEERMSSVSKKVYDYVSSATP